MPKYLFTFTRTRTIEDVLEIPVQAWSVHEAKQKLAALQESDDYDETEYYSEEWSNLEWWWESIDPFTQDWEPVIIDPNDE